MREVGALAVTPEGGVLVATPATGGSPETPGGSGHGPAAPDGAALERCTGDTAPDPGKCTASQTGLQAGASITALRSVAIRARGNLPCPDLEGKLSDQLLSHLCWTDRNIKLGASPTVTKLNRRMVRSCHRRLSHRRTATINEHCRQGGRIRLKLPIQMRSKSSPSLKWTQQFSLRRLYPPIPRMRPGTYHRHHISNPKSCHNSSSLKSCLNISSNQRSCHINSNPKFYPRLSLTTVVRRAQSKDQLYLLPAWNFLTGLSGNHQSLIRLLVLNQNERELLISVIFRTCFMI